LDTQGGSAQEWAKLIRSLVILEDQDQALEIWEKAKTVFTQYPNDLAIIATVAKETGVIK
jgi:cytochrome c-type biogenesis protein CcmH